MQRTQRMALPALGVIGLIAAIAIAQAADDPQPAQPEPLEAGVEQPVTDSSQPSAEQVLNELLQRQADNPLIEPARPPAVEPAPATPGYAPGEGGAAAAIGSSPQAGKTRLLREGAFVIQRRGRLVRTTGDAASWVFVFEADTGGQVDPPMYMMPCQMLEDMERIVAERGDSIVFIVSGKVYVYRGSNYLLPNLMKLAPHRGNLEQ